MLSCHVIYCYVMLMLCCYAVIFAWFCPCFLGWFLANSSFSLRDINLTLGLLLPRGHVVWRDSVSVRSSRPGLKSECADIFHLSLISGCYAILTSPKKGETAVYGYNRAVLSSFGVVLMSCRVNFHVVRSALQYSACRI